MQPAPPEPLNLASKLGSWRKKEKKKRRREMGDFNKIQVLIGTSWAESWQVAPQSAATHQRVKN